MMLPPSHFKTIASVALIAFALAVVAFGVMPAQAQQGPALNFSLGMPDIDSGQSRSIFGFGGSTGSDRHGHENGAGDARDCLSDRAVLRGVENRGYAQVEVTRSLPRDRVEVAGQNGNWLYSMRVDKCTGEVDRVERVRRVQGGGFGLQFNFGN